MSYSIALNVVLARRGKTRVWLAEQLQMTPAMITYFCKTESEQRLNEMLAVIDADKGEFLAEVERSKKCQTN